MRHPKEKPMFPKFTAGLEAMLTKTIGEDATKLINYLRRLTDSEAQPVREYSEDHYTFSRQLLYKKPKPFLPGDAGYFSACYSRVDVERHEKIFEITIAVDTQNKLLRYDFRLRTK